MLFQKGYPIDSLAYIPTEFNGAGSNFILRAGVVNISKIDMHVFEAKAKKEDFLNGLNKDLIHNSAKDLIVGSMLEAHLNGNWQ